MAIPEDIQRQIEAVLKANGLVRDGQIVSILPSSKAGKDKQPVPQRPRAVAH